MTWATIFQAAIGVLGVASAIYATWQGWKGRQADLEQQRAAAELAAEQKDRERRFETLNESIANLRRDLTYYSTELEKARKEQAVAVQEKNRLQHEWLQRHELLLANCQRLTSELELLLDETLLTPDQRSEVLQVLRDAQRHIREDHRWFTAKVLED